MQQITPTFINNLFLKIKGSQKKWILKLLKKYQI
jgi:hypothetical protein